MRRLAIGAELRIAQSVAFRYSIRAGCAPADVGDKSASMAVFSKFRINRQSMLRLRRLRKLLTFVKSNLIGRVILQAYGINQRGKGEKRTQVVFAANRQR